MTIKIYNEHGNVRVIKTVYDEMGHDIDKTIFPSIKPGEMVEIDLFSEIKEQSILVSRI